jgi:hypothetical protein
MIRVTQRQYDGSSLVIAWDPGILWVDSLATGTDGRASCYFLEGSIVGSRCFSSFKLIWDPWIISSFRVVYFVVHMGVMALLEDTQYLGRKDLSCP